MPTPTSSSSSTAAWNTAEHKIEVLEGNPATANLTAVKEGKYLILPFAASEAGVRSVEAASELAYQLDSPRRPMSRAPPEHGSRGSGASHSRSRSCCRSSSR